MAATVHVAWAADLLGYDFGPGHPMAPLRLHLTIELARALGVLEPVPDPALTPQSDAQLVIRRADGSRQEVTVTLRIDTPIEVDYYQAGGILPFVLRQLLQG